MICKKGYKCFDLSVKAIDVSSSILLTDPENLRVIFGKDPLEDDMTLVFYKITHLSVLFFVLKMPGGGMTYYSTDVHFVLFYMSYTLLYIYLSLI